MWFGIEIELDVKIADYKFTNLIDIVQVSEILAQT